MADAGVSVVQWDLIPRMTPFLDRHLVLPLLDFLDEKHIYPAEDIKRAKLDLLAPTNMIDYMDDIQRGQDGVSADSAQRKAEVVQVMQRLAEGARPLLSLGENEEFMKQLKESSMSGKASLLAEKGVTDEVVKSLFGLAKHLYECGQYDKANAHLVLCREVCTEPEMLQNVLWGKLATNILAEKWTDALRDLQAIKEIIDTRQFLNPTGQLQQRTWLLHWSLPIFFNAPDTRSQLLEFYQNDRTWSAIQTSCPHLLRYVAVASVISKRRLKDLIKLLDQESYEYSDPVTKFLETLYGPTDFEAAEEQLALCAQLMDADPYLHLVKGEFLECCRLLIFELFCKLHSCIDTKLLAQKLDMSPEDSEKWIVNLIRGAKLDAKIDTAANQVLIGSQTLPLYQQLIDRTRNILRHVVPLQTGPKKHHHSASQYKESRATSEQ